MCPNARQGVVTGSLGGGRVCALWDSSSKINPKSLSKGKIHTSGTPVKLKTTDDIFSTSKDEPGWGSVTDYGAQEELQNIHKTLEKWILWGHKKTSRFLNPRNRKGWIWRVTRRWGGWAGCWTSAREAHAFAITNRTLSSIAMERSDFTFWSIHYYLMFLSGCVEEASSTRWW